EDARLARFTEIVQRSLQGWRVIAIAVAYRTVPGLEISPTWEWAKKLILINNRSGTLGSIPESGIVRTFPVSVMSPLVLSMLKDPPEGVKCGTAEISNTTM
ncbi:MAG: hypothetical protein HC773_23080, partial [Scytonema sp. CRU_2_7]|nr:hypothetical protein [Scytonema sp. CRU_2_7]